MLKKDFIFNCWQVYAESQKLYNEKTNVAFRKVLFLNDRQDVLDFKMFRIDNDVIIVGKNESSVYFAFIGSNDLMDWFSNFDAKMIPVYGSNDIKVHDGFYTSAMKFKNIINVEALLYRNKHINFIGHSRGGSLAMISAIEYAMDNDVKNHINVVTYGQPRAGNHQYDRLLLDKSINYCRVYFRNDIVTEVPPIELGYEHPWFGDKLVLKAAWWHNIPFMFKRVHLDYDRVITTKFIKEVYINNNQDY